MRRLRVRSVGLPYCAGRTVSTAFEYPVDKLRFPHPPRSVVREPYAVRYARGSAFPLRAFVPREGNLRVSNNKAESGRCHNTDVLRFMSDSCHKVPIPEIGSDLSILSR